MIRFQDAVQLTRTKFKTRRVRTIFAALSLSIGSIIILTLVVFSGGIMHFAKDLFRDSLASRSFASEQLGGAVFLGGMPGSPVPEQYVNTEQNTTDKEVHPEQYLEKYTAEGVKQVYVSHTVSRFGFTFSGEKFDLTKYNRSATNISSSDSLFVTDAIYDGYSFDNNYEGKIPIIIPSSFILGAEKGAQGFSLPDPKDQYEAIQQYAPAYIGQTFTLGVVKYADGSDEQNTTELTDVQVIVVGIAKSNLFSIGGYYPGYNFIIPNWALDAQDNMKQFFKNSENNLVYEFDTKEQRDAFVKAHQQSLETFVMPMYGPYEMLQEGFKFFRRVAYGIGGFFLVTSALFLMTTLGKIIVDSKQEIGVFRAVGAQKKDIRKIYLIYSWILSSLGYGVGLSIAYILAIITSLKWGEKMFYFVSIVGTSYDVPSPKFIFIGFPVVALLVFYIVTIGIALFASLLPMSRAAKIDPVKVLREQ
ncbi:MAG: FtsX-like permease family protein [Candidatus Kerfeldbacteria bacterium]|nr:FtsX-like permease family protein [Candidatus Kerfeldbacteria bacterium]